MHVATRWAMISSATHSAALRHIREARAPYAPGAMLARACDRISRHARPLRRRLLSRTPNFTPQKFRCAFLPTTRESTGRCIADDAARRFACWWLTTDWLPGRARALATYADMRRQCSRRAFYIKQSYFTLRAAHWLSRFRITLLFSFIFLAFSILLSGTPCASSDICSRADITHFAAALCRLPPPVTILRRRPAHYI